MFVGRIAQGFFLQARLHTLHSPAISFHLLSWDRPFFSAFCARHNCQFFIFSRPLFLARSFLDQPLLAEAVNDRSVWVFIRLFCRILRHVCHMSAIVTCFCVKTFSLSCSGRYRPDIATCLSHFCKSVVTCFCVKTFSLSCSGRYRADIATCLSHFCKSVVTCFCVKNVLLVLLRALPST